MIFWYVRVRDHEYHESWNRVPNKIKEKEKENPRDWIFVPCKDDQQTYVLFRLSREDERDETSKYMSVMRKKFCWKQQLQRHRNRAEKINKIDSRCYEIKLYIHTYVGRSDGLDRKVGLVGASIASIHFDSFSTPSISYRIILSHRFFP